MKIATWNVNSIRSRLERLLAWLKKAQPDILCLQELKTTDEVFPYEPIRQAGFNAAVFGQKKYNGVAILSRIEPSHIERCMGDDEEDSQARFLAAQIGPVHIISAYVPNGQVVGTEPYAYKLRWLARLRTFLKRRFTPASSIVVCGDFNVARDEKDVARPDAWANSVLFHPTSRAAMEELLAWGLVDLFRQQHPEGGQYSWWDYRMLAFPKNDGLRLDYLLATESLAKSCTVAEIDRDERKGTKPSDHVPVIAVLRQKKK
ncbi:MAG: exodeoxyribonuclease III [Thermoguttaceae bacterium]|jgi:exodeoxyribonuclease-3